MKQNVNDMKRNLKYTNRLVEAAINFLMIDSCLKNVNLTFTVNFTNVRQSFKLN